jgi:hypothetical protein
MYETNRNSQMVAAGEKGYAKHKRINQNLYKRNRRENERECLNEANSNLDIVR